MNAFISFFKSFMEIKYLLHHNRNQSQNGYHSFIITSYETGIWFV
jgi:hypothetical protein